MNWFLIICIAFGALLGILPTIITNSIKKGVELQYWERDKHFRRASSWLLVFAWVIIVWSMVLPIKLIVEQDKEIKELNERVDSILMVGPLPADTFNIEKENVD